MDELDIKLIAQRMANGDEIKLTRQEFETLAYGDVSEVAQLKENLKDVEGELEDVRDCFNELVAINEDLQDSNEKLKDEIKRLKEGGNND